MRQQGMSSFVCLHTGCCAGELPCPPYRMGAAGFSLSGASFTPRHRIALQKAVTDEHDTFPHLTVMQHLQDGQLGGTAPQP